MVKMILMIIILDYVVRNTQEYVLSIKFHSLPSRSRNYCD